MNASATSPHKTPVQEKPAFLEGIRETEEHGLIVLSPASGRPTRRVLYVNAYGGREVWGLIKSGIIPPHHLWGCLELVRRGYEVALAEPLRDFYWRRRAVPHDLIYLKLVRSWLGKDGIVFCGHNVLYWIPFLKRLGILGCRVVSLLYAREPLNQAVAHSGILALNPAAAEQARRLAPQAKVATLAWGVDVPSFPLVPYQPDWFLSCGVTQRDHLTLSASAARSAQLPVRILAPSLPAECQWSPNVELFHRSKDSLLPHHRLVEEYYAPSAAVLIIVKEDRPEVTGCGFTNLIESMAMARPVIMTKTGAVPSELDVEAAGCGLWVKPGDPDSLAEAMNTLHRDPALAEAMGRKGRELVEQRYNIRRFATELDEFFSAL